MLTLLEHGWNVLIADADAVWFEDPRPYLWRGVRQGAGIIAQDDVTMLCGGFMLLLSNGTFAGVGLEALLVLTLDRYRKSRRSLARGDAAL